MVIAPIAEQHDRDRTAGRGGADRQVDKDRPGATMASNGLIEPASGEPVVGGGAVELKAGVPMAQLVSCTEYVAPEALHPERLG